MPVCADFLLSMEYRLTVHSIAASFSWEKVDADLRLTVALRIQVSCSLLHAGQNGRDDGGVTFRVRPSRLLFGMEKRGMYRYMRTHG